MSKLGTKSRPMTAKNSTAEDRAHKFCRCDKCGIVARCEPEFDFFVVDDVLTCERCVGVGISMLAECAPQVAPRDEAQALVELVVRHGPQIELAWRNFPFAIVVRGHDREMVFGLQRVIAERYARVESKDAFLREIGRCVREHASRPSTGLPLFVLQQRGRRNLWRSKVLHSIFMTRGGQA